MSYYVRSPLSGWLGGKFQLAKTIVKKIPEHQCYVEPFAGAAWVLFHKPESRSEVINDINSDVVNLYRVLQNHHEEFVNHFKWVLSAREEFQRRIHENPDTLTDIQRAVRFFYLHKLAFAGRNMGGKPTLGTATTSPPRLDLTRIGLDATQVYLRLQRVLIEHLNYDDLIRRYDRPHTFFYLDPPYWDCEDDYGKGVFDKDDFAKLAEQLQQIKGKFLLSLNDTEGVRELFAAFNMEGVKVRYSSSRTARPTASELFISNY